MRHRACAVVSLCVSILTVTPAARAAGDDDLAPARSPAAAFAAFVPGLVLHGSGSYVAGQRVTAYRLLAAEGVGLALLGAGLGGLAVTGASRRVVAPLALVSIGGAALFATSAFADLYAVLGPGGRDSPAPLRTLPWIETRAGVFALHDPAFRHGVFTQTGLDLRVSAFRVSPTAWLGTGDATRRLRLEGAYRFVGPTTADVSPWDASRAREPSSLDLDVALMQHDIRREDVSRTTGEIGVSGRYAMEKIAPALRGSFAEGGLGLGLASVRHAHGHDTDTLLLARFGYGFFLGSAACSRGDVVAFYDHRRDALVGGMKVPGIGAGYLGSVGMRARAYLDERVGVSVEAHAGSAIMAGASIVFREGGKP